MAKLKLEHRCLCATDIFQSFVKECMGSEQTIKSNYRAHGRMIKRLARKPGEISSEDEAVLSQQQIHVEHSVDAFGRPIEFDGEDLMTSAANKKTARKTREGKENLFGDSFMIISPDSDSDHKCFVWQVMETNADPDDPTTWTVNNKHKWHFRVGWWELSRANHLGKIQKCKLHQGIQDLFNSGKNNDIDTNDDEHMQQYRHGKKAWWMQYIDRDVWYDREWKVNQDMNGKRVSDRSFPRKLVTALAKDHPGKNLDNEIERIPSVAPSVAPSVEVSEEEQPGQQEKRKRKKKGRNNGGRKKKPKKKASEENEGDVGDTGGMHVEQEGFEEEHVDDGQQQAASSTDRRWLVAVPDNTGGAAAAGGGQHRSGGQSGQQLALFGAQDPGQSLALVSVQSVTGCRPKDIILRNSARRVLMVADSDSSGDRSDNSRSRLIRLLRKNDKIEREKHEYAALHSDDSSIDEKLVAQHERYPGLQKSMDAERPQAAQTKEQTNPIQSSSAAAGGGGVASSKRTKVRKTPPKKKEASKKKNSSDEMGYESN